MNTLLGALLLVASTVFLKSYFRWALLDPFNILSLPGPWKCWFLAISSSLAVTLALLLSQAGQLLTVSQILRMAALSTVITPAITGPTKYSKHEVPDKVDRYRQNKIADIGSSISMTVVTFFVSFMSSVIWQGAWVFTLAIIGWVLLTGKLQYFQARAKKIMSRKMAQSTIDGILGPCTTFVPIGYVMWVVAAGSAIDTIEGIGASNWNGYFGIILGFLISVLPRWIKWPFQ